MSKLIINWEKEQINKNNKLFNIINLLNYSKYIFLKDYKLSFAINNFIMEKDVKYDLCEVSFILNYFAQNNTLDMKYEEVFDMLKDFFNKAILKILEDFHSIKIDDNMYLNVYYKDQVVNIFLETDPITSVFELSSLKNKPFNYDQRKIDIIIHSMLFLKNKISNKNAIIKLWNLYFFSHQRKGCGIAFANDFLQKINKKISSEKLIIETINYNEIIKKILEDKVI